MKASSAPNDWRDSHGDSERVVIEASKKDRDVDRLVDAFWQGEKIPHDMTKGYSRNPNFCVISPAGWYVMRDTYTKRNG